jgi:hypothetical protein
MLIEREGCGINTFPRGEVRVHRGVNNAVNYSAFRVIHNSAKVNFHEAGSELPKKSPFYLNILLFLILEQVFDISLVHISGVIRISRDSKGKAILFVPNIAKVKQIYVSVSYGCSELHPPIRGSFTILIVVAIDTEPSINSFDFQLQDWDQGTSHLS